MLGKETKAIRDVLKRLERNRKQLEKHVDSIDELFYNLDKKTLNMLLTLKQ